MPFYLPRLRLRWFEASLLEVTDTCSKDRLLFVAGQVLRHLATSAFGVRHFAEDSSAGAGDAFDGGQ